MVAVEKPVPPRLELAQRAKEDFRIFIREAWKVLEPAQPLLWNWHVDALAIHLQALYNREITRLIIGLSPGHAKSTIVSQMFPVWCWVNDPYSRWLCASHSLDLAIRDNVYRRRLIESDWFQGAYGHIFQFAGDQNLKGFFQNDKRGHMMALAVRSSGTGKRGTALLIDDANNAMAGEADVKKTVEWFGRTWISRINDQENGMQVVVGQRLRENDLIGHLLDQRWGEHLCLPEEYDPARKCVTSIGWEDPRTEDGQPLWSEKFSKQTLDKLKREMGPEDYAAQYDQSPIPATGGTFKQSNERLFTRSLDAFFLHTPCGIKAISREDCVLFLAVDPAISEKQTADFTAIGLWAKTELKDLLLLEVLHGRWDHHDQQDEIQDAFGESNAEFVAVEAVAYQHALFQDLVVRGMPCRPFTPHKDKVARASTASIWQANGKIYFLKDAPWLPELQKELYKFPKYRHDDQVDMISLASVVVRSRGPLSDDIDDEEIPEAVEETGGLIPLTEPLNPEARAKVELLPVVKPETIDPFKYADEHGLFGGDW